MGKRKLASFLIILISIALGLAGCESRMSNPNIQIPTPIADRGVETAIATPQVSIPQSHQIENKESESANSHSPEPQTEPIKDLSIKDTPVQEEKPGVVVIPVTPTPAPIPILTLKSKETPRVIRIPVLNYHSIGIQPGNNAVISPKNLGEQMDYLAKQDYTTLTLRQFIDIWEGRMEAPSKSVLLTFDDGYADNHHSAMPILKKHDFKAVLFMSPGSVGDGWYLDWEQAKELHEAGWDVQPHGMTHPYLNKLSPEKQRAEIEESARLIEEHLGIRAEVFCYPYGVYNKETFKILTDNHFKYAFTIDQGYTETSQNPYQLKRLFIGGSDTLPTFISKLTKG